MRAVGSARHESVSNNLARIVDRIGFEQLCTTAVGIDQRVQVLQSAVAVQKGRLLRPQIADDLTSVVDSVGDTGIKSKGAQIGHVPACIEKGVGMEAIDIAPACNFPVAADSL